MSGALIYFTSLPVLLSVIMPCSIIDDNGRKKFDSMKKEPTGKHYAIFQGGESCLTIFPTCENEGITLKGRAEIKDFICQLLEHCYESSRLDAMYKELKKSTKFNYPVFHVTISENDGNERRTLRIIPPENEVIALHGCEETDEFIRELQCQRDNAFEKEDYPDASDRVISTWFVHE